MPMVPVSVVLLHPQSRDRRHRVHFLRVSDTEMNESEHQTTLQSYFKVSLDFISITQ